MVNFGDRVLCSIDGCELEAIVRKDNKLFCKVHIPKNKPQRIGKYSGKSQTPYGSYENR